MMIKTSLFKKMAYLLLLLVGGGVVSVSVLGFIPIAIATHYPLGLLIGIIGIFIGGIISAFACDKLLEKNRIRIKDTSMENELGKE